MDLVRTPMGTADHWDFHQSRAEGPRPAGARVHRCGARRGEPFGPDLSAWSGSFGGCGWDSHRSVHQSHVPHQSRFTTHLHLTGATPAIPISAPQQRVLGRPATVGTDALDGCEGSDVIAVLTLCVILIAYIGVSGPPRSAGDCSLDLGLAQPVAASTASPTDVAGCLINGDRCSPSLSPWRHTRSREVWAAVASSRRSWPAWHLVASRAQAAVRPTVAEAQPTRVPRNRRQA